MKKFDTTYYKNKLQYETDSWDLRESIKQGAKIVIVDVRSNSLYKKEHIKGAINFPHREMNKESAEKILPGFDFEYVTYCTGIGCNGSTKGALKLAELGYQVKELTGGIKWWIDEGYETVSE